MLSPPLVKVFAPAVLVETVPAPASEPIVSLALTLYVVPLATVTAVVLSNVPETVNVPALIVVAPVYVLAPDKVKVEVLVSLVKAPDPDITPDNVWFVEDEYLNNPLLVILAE